ncbi:MAG: GWxTD domain-containing protein [Armatimonadetes bacterium]|nr:GWxTD domain-containing protein [Armatimonadota bacterium]
MKKSVLFYFTLLIFLSASAEELNVIVDNNRFLDNSNNTILEINYQVPYNDLQFEKTELGFEALLDVNISISKAGKELHNQEFTNNIIVTEHDKTLSDQSFKDKISIVLSKSGFLISVIFCNNENEKKWEYEFEILSRESLVSDLEFSSFVIADTTDYLQKFHRDGKLFIVNPSHIFELQTNEKIFLYYELQNFFTNENNELDFSENIYLIRKEETIKKIESKIKREATEKIYQIKEIDISAFEPGLYDLHLEIIDNVSGIKQTREDFFCIKEKTSRTPRNFPELEDEFRLIRYFLSSAEQKKWKNLSENGKLNFLERFWFTHDSNPATEKNEFFEEIKERIAYCNLHFSHFKDGWETDMGRIYIRNGKPDEVIKANTGLNARYIQRDYQIWKYRMDQIRTYIFLDLQTSGNFKIIYIDNDFNETSWQNFDKYLGDDFDWSLIE